MTGCLADQTIVDLVENRIDGETRAMAETHIDGCDACRRLLAATMLSLAASTPAASTHPTRQRGACVGRYVLIAAIGAGSMGVVYSAFDPELHREVALKLVRTQEDPEERNARVLREARAMARLSHPNVITVYDVGPFQDEIFVAMELVRGSTLRAWLAQTPRDTRSILAMYLQAGRGLAAAHEVGIVHRDFKPDNVLVGNDGRVRVTDFGLARAQGAALSKEPVSDDSGATQVSAVAGTPAYMAPEQVRGRADAASDQYAFSVALYEALYGERPFARESPDRIGDPSFPAATRVPARVRRALARGLRVSPAERYGSMKELLADLEVSARNRSTSLAVAGAIGALVLSVSFAARWQRVPTPASCSGADAKLAGVWDGARKDAVAQALRATGKPFADDASNAVAATLDAYASQWKAERTDACEATRIRGEQSDEVLTLRMECFDRRAGDLRALSDLLARADGAVVEHAVAAANALPSLASCSDVPALLATVRPPEDPGVRKRVQDLSDELERLRALDAAGKSSDALADATRAATTARELAYRPAEAEALYLLGVVQSKTADFKSAVSTFYDAVSAAEAGRHDILAAQAWATLVDLLGARLDRFDEAETCEKRALAAIERTAGRGRAPFVLARAVGGMDRERGRYAAAVVKDEEAVALEKKALGAGSLEEATTLTELANALRENDDLDAAEKAYEESLAIEEQQLGPAHPDIATTLQGLGILYANAGRYEDARAQYERALAIRERALGDSHPDVAQTLSSLVVAMRWSGQSRQALPLAERALHIALAAFGPDHDVTCGALNNLGFVEYALGDYASARRAFEEALAVRTRVLGPDSPKVSIELTNLGQTVLAQGDARGALDAYRRAHAIDQKSLKPDHPALAYSLVGLGRSYLALHQPDRALPELERANALRESHRMQPRALAETRFALARGLWETGSDRRRALSLAAQARDGYASSGPGFDAERSEIQAWMGMAEHPPRP
jgi:tetratricopeptide (TPR) repeat protein